MIVTPSSEQFQLLLLHSLSMSHLKIYSSLSQTESDLTHCPLPCEQALLYSKKSQTLKQTGLNQRIYCVRNKKRKIKPHLPNPRKKKHLNASKVSFHFTKHVKLRLNFDSWDSFIHCSLPPLLLPEGRLLLHHITCPLGHIHFNLQLELSQEPLHSFKRHAIA